MAIHDPTSQRLFVEHPLTADATVPCTPEQSNYLLNVMRMKPGGVVLVFNGRDGEWRARIATAGKKSCNLAVEANTREQIDGPDIDYLFAPLKHARLDYMVQKATELGAARLRPVLTRHTIADRVNLDRMKANAIEAAEQCGVLRVPGVADVEKLISVIASWDSTRQLIFCDEGAPVSNPLSALAAIPPGPVAVLIGPEGGFAAEERELLLSKPYTVALSLGPRVMRADTAAVAALALVNATLGDWKT